MPDPPAVGPVLRAARQAKQLTLAEAARATNIRQSYLEALENDDALDAFPAPVYERFFLREYASFLGAESEPVVKALEARLENIEPDIDIPPPAVPPPRRWMGRVLAVAAAGGLVFLVVASLRSHPAPHPTATQRPTVPASGSPAPPSLKPSPTLVQLRGVQARLSFSAPCWVRATVDGKVVLARTFPAKTSVTLHGGRRVDLVLGNAGGANLRVNGERVRTGRDGEVVTLSFVWKNGHLSQTG